MKSKNLAKYSIYVIFFCNSLWAQTHTKTYKENFKVKPEAVIEIDLHQTELEIHTWDKNEVSVEGSIELKDVPQGRAEVMLKNIAFSILGNSERVEIKNKPRFNNRPVRTKVVANVRDFTPKKKWTAKFRIDTLELVYLDKSKSINIDSLKQEMEDTRKKIKAAREAHFEARVVHNKHRRELLKQRRELLQAPQRIGDSIYVKNKAAITAEDLDSVDFIELYNLFDNISDKMPSKVVRKLKLYIPKNALLEVNLRHSQLKISENIQNIQANLIYTSMLAEHISGKNTQINARFSPLQINQWELGNLKLQFSESTNLKSVNSIDLIANNSPINIDHLSGKVNLKINFSDLTTSFGKSLEQLYIDAFFSNLEIGSLENIDVLYLSAEDSEVSIPKKHKKKFQNLNNDQNKKGHKIKLTQSKLKAVE